MSRLDALNRAIEDTAAAAGFVLAAIFAFDVLCDFIAWVIA